MANNWRKLLSILLMVALQYLPEIHLSLAEEATTPSVGDVQFSGWKPMLRPEALDTTQFAKRVLGSKFRNASDTEVSETRRSFLLLYPPRSPVQGEQKTKNLQQNSPRNLGPPLRAYPTQSRYQRIKNFGSAEVPSGGAKKAPNVFQRPKFPPVANPPPLPKHALRNRKKLPPNFTPESTSQHQVQIQLLDGYIVPPSGGAVSALHAEDKGTQISTFPLNLNNVPEIRLLLPGDVHQQLQSLRQPQKQGNGPSKPDIQGHAVGNKEVQDPSRDRLRNSQDGRIPNHNFESQRHPDPNAIRNPVISNNNRNAEPPHKIPGEVRPQQGNYNLEHRIPANGFSQPDANIHPEQISFPGPDNAIFHKQTFNHVPHNQQNAYNSEAVSNFNVPNRSNHPEEPKLDPRAPVAPANTQNFVPDQRNTYSITNQYQQKEVRYPQQISQGPVITSYSNQPTRHHREESFRPLSVENYNHFNRQNQNYKGPSQAGQSVGKLNVQINQNNGQYKIGQNLNHGQNGWRVPQSLQGNQNFNTASLPPENQNFYSIQPGSNAQRISSQGNSQNVQQTFHYFTQDIGNQNTGKTRFKQGNSIQDILNQQKVTDNLAFVSAQPEISQHTSTLSGFNTQGTPEDQIYFIPPVPNKDDIQTQIEAFDDPKNDGSLISDDTRAQKESSKGETGVIEQKEIQPDVDDSTGTTSVTKQPDTPVDRNGFCECTLSCAPIQRSPDENFGSSIREIARSLNADAFFDFVGLSDEEIESLLSSDGPYTLFIPSNEAVSRLPSNLIDHWRENNPDLTLALLNHAIQDVVTLDQLKQGGRMTSRARGATIFINNYNNEAVTVNGHRIVHGDVTAPKGGIIHVIDGTLCPVADQDIINTLRTCNKYDGFLTLADVTKLLEE
ncbi:Transforming growth factor-beta-induced protein ig-h3, partial [Stegodyphus mimosarum]